MGTYNPKDGGKQIRFSRAEEKDYNFGESVKR